MIYKEFWQLLIHGYGRVPLAALICAVTIVVALLEGFNVGLLVPLLETLESSNQAQPHWVSRAFGRIFDSLSLSLELEIILVTLAIFVLSMAALKYLRSILVAKIRLGFVVWLRSRVMRNLLNTDVAFFHRENLGRLTDNLTTQTEQAGYSVFLITEILASLGIIVAYLIAAFLISPVLTSLAFALMLVVSLSVQPIIAKARELGSSRVLRNNDLQAAALESLGGIRLIKSFLLERVRWMHYDRRAQGVADILYKVERNHSQVLVIQEAALFALIGAMVYVGVMALSLEIAVIMTILFVLFRMMPKVSGINTLRQQLVITMEAFRAIKTTLDETAQPRIVGGDKPFRLLGDGVEFREVFFSHDGYTPVLDGLGLTIEKGRMTAIVGESGAGKSTIVDLILRYYDPEKGNVFVDGSNLKELDLPSWRNAIGIVSQDVFLFNDTIANNIELGSQGASSEAIIEAAKKAYAHDFIQLLPEGYETAVGDRGMNLSGGERQRIALARAILKQPQILILDEATSALDSESEQLIQQYINSIRGTCTILVVAHRMSTIQDADKIVVLQDGKIIEQGDWNSLAAGTGVSANYRRLQSTG